MIFVYGSFLSFWYSRGFLYHCLNLIMYISSIILALLVFIARACDFPSQTEIYARDFPTRVEVHSRADIDSPVSPLPWGYGATDGPILWYGMNSVNWSTCARGKHQSPINLLPCVGSLDSSSDYFLDFSQLTDVPVSRIHYRKTDIVGLHKTNTLIFSGNIYNLAQFTSMCQTSIGYMMSLLQSKRILCTKKLVEQ